MNVGIPPPLQGLGPAPMMLQAFAPGVAPNYPAPPPLPPPPMPPLPPQPFQLPPPPPPPAWRGLTNFVNRRPAGPDLIAFEQRCNAIQNNGAVCPKAAACFRKKFLPVCKLHKKQRLLQGHCKAVVPGAGVCNQMIKWTPPFFQLCSAHREWTGMTCHILRLPTEVRMEIFRYLLPDQPISAWLDTSLRSDGYKCTASLLLVNKEIHREASHVLYRTHPFTVSIQKNSLNLCGRSYYHDLSGSQLTTPNPHPHLRMLPVRPPMLSKIKSVRIQLVMIKPNMRPHRRGRLRMLWDEEVEMYDLKDSVKSFVEMIQKEHSLNFLSLVLCTQNQLDDWEDECQFEFLQLVSSPFRQLRTIPTVELHCIYHCTDNLRMNSTQYILDKLRPRWVNVPRIPDVVGETGPNYQKRFPPQARIASDDIFDLSNCFDTFGIMSQRPPILTVSKRLHKHTGFLTLKETWEKEISSSGPAPPENCSADTTYKAFRKAYNLADTHYFSRLPKGRDWMLHQARVAREKGDVQAIHQLKMSLHAKINAYGQADLLALKVKQKELLNGFNAYEEAMRVVESNKHNKVSDDTLIEVLEEEEN